MSRNPQQNITQIIIPPQPSNGLGVAGFIIALIGLVSCGFLAPLGLILSAVGLRKEPRGLAIAGTVISLISFIPLIIFGGTIFAFVVGVLGLSSVLSVQIANQSSAREAATIIESQRAGNQSLPSDSVGTASIAGKVDFWKTPLHYQREGRTFEIISAGADKQFGTADDVRFSETNLITTSTGPSIPGSNSSTPRSPTAP